MWSQNSRVVPRDVIPTCFAKWLLAYVDCKILTYVISNEHHNIWLALHSHQYYVKQPQCAKNGQMVYTFNAEKACNDEVLHIDHSNSAA